MVLGAGDLPSQNVDTRGGVLASAVSHTNNDSSHWAVHSAQTSFLVAALGESQCGQFGKLIGTNSQEPVLSPTQISQWAEEIVIFGNELVLYTFNNFRSCDLLSKNPVDTPRSNSQKKRLKTYFLQLSFTHF